MRLIALAPLAVAVSEAGGIGFLAAGTEVKSLKEELLKAADLVKRSSLKSAHDGILPIGVGFINWNIHLDHALEACEDNMPAIVWFFAPQQNEDLAEWTEGFRKFSKGRIKVWIQVGTVSDALQIAGTCRPDVLVIQGADAGGHGLVQSAGTLTLLPEASDTLHEAGLGDIPLFAAGGIVEGRGTAACLALGADGVVMGTRFLASKEASIPKGHQNDVLRTSDGGVSTVRTKVYDQLRGTADWPAHFNGRGIINQSFLDAQDGKTVEENKMLYQEALSKGDHGWGEVGRLTAYAGAGVGLVKQIKPARDILEEVRNDTVILLSKLSKSLSKL